MAEWRHVALLNFEAPAALLEPLVPVGTELDLDRGRAFVSLVGFRFLDTRVLGCRIPGHVDFDEINLRFYVRREVGGETRRAVTFIREIVPRRAIAALARAVYNEPYVALPMHSEIANRDADASTRAAYGWRSHGIEHRFELRARGVPAVAAPGSHEHFIAEHYWGYTRQRDGTTIEYQVAHPAWLLRSADSVEVSRELGAYYGPGFAEVLARGPASAFLADGSAVSVSPPRRLP
jgi:uncharacterized protein YqjF (DUF2071 family)